jgi:hypothetical protein
MDLPPGNGHDWTDEERVQIRRLERVCRDAPEWEMECSQTDAGDPCRGDSCETGCRQMTARLITLPATADLFFRPEQKRPEFALRRFSNLARVWSGLAGLDRLRGGGHAFF